MTKRRLFWVLGTLLLAGAGVAAALFLTNRRDVTTSSQAAYEAYEEAILNQKRFYAKEARVGFAKALELDPHFAMAMLYLADQSDHDQAVTLIRRAARERDRLTERERYHVDIALANIDGKSDRSLELARELHAKFPSDVAGVMLLARNAILKGDPDGAIKFYEDLLTVDPNNAEAYNIIGYYYGYRGEYEKAIDNLERYRFISRDNANPFDSLAENQAYSGHYNEAIENLNRALAIKPDFVPAYQHLGVVYEGLGDYAKAIQNYEKGFQIADSDSMRREFLFMAMRAALYGGDSAETRRIIGQIEKIPVDPKSDYAKAGPAFIAIVNQFVEGHPVEAERALRDLKPKLQENWEAAQKAGKITPGVKPHFPQWNFLMARTLEAQGKTDEALTYWQANANPPNAFYDFDARRWIMEARAKVAEGLARKGDIDGAEKLIAENRKWNPSWAPCRASETFVAEARRAKVLAASK